MRHEPLDPGALGTPTREPGSAGELDILLHHPIVTRVSRAMRERQPRRAETHAIVRRAAVALIVRRSDQRTAGDLEVLLIKRAMYEGDPWSGHIALPGGRQEPEDESLERTAIRETLEETAIDLARSGRVLGSLDDVEPRSRVLPPLAITPFVAIVPRALPLTLSAEVADAFWISLAVLRDPRASRDVELELAGGSRVVRSFQHAGHTIWGLTERILRQFLEYAGLEGP
jgi:8-oxo-dGTP pyrophosphatase MutT (NUDIX family)